MSWAAAAVRSWQPPDCPADNRCVRHSIVAAEAQGSMVLGQSSPGRSDVPHTHLRPRLTPGQTLHTVRGAIQRIDDW